MSAAEFHRSILMSSAGNLRSIILETNSFRNTSNGVAYPMELNDHHPHMAHHPGSNGRVAQPHSRFYEIYANPDAELLSQEKVAQLELEKTKLIQMNTLLLNESMDWKKKYENVRQQQQQRMANNNVGEAVPFPHGEARLANIERQLNLLVNAHAMDSSHIQKLAGMIGKLNVNMEEMKTEFASVKDFVSRGWVEVHDYQEVDPARLQQQQRMPADENLFERRNSGPLRIDNGMANSNAYNDGIRGGSAMEATNGAEVVAADINASAAAFLERRQSDSTTITTIESGYCDDREEVFENGENGGGNDHEQRGKGNRDGMMRGDDDIEFVAEVITPKAQRSSSQSGSQSQPSTSDAARKEYNNGSQSVGADGQRRPSVFSRGYGSRPVALFDDFDDADNQNNTGSVQVSGPRPPLDPEISSLNEIFDTNANSQNSIESCEENSTDSSSITPAAIKRKRASIASTEQKRIRGIAKAPLKREPGTLSIYSARGSQNQSESPVHPSNTPPAVPAPDKILETLRSIKKERVAHAIDGYLINQNVWKCICGHQTTTKNGMKLHVKNMGTEEARYMCPWSDCAGRFLFPFLVRNHLVKDHKDNTVPDKLFGCEKCYKIFYDKTNLKTHRNARNEICKSTPRRRSYASRALSLSGGPGLNRPQPPRQVIVNRASNSESPKRPSIIITL